MKKAILCVVCILIIIIIVITIKISDNQQKQKNMRAINQELEAIYKDKTLYGAEVLTIINKAIDNNYRYQIKTDNEGYYIDDNEYCLKVELILLGMDEEGQVYEKKYPMETLQKARIRRIYSKFFFNQISV